MGLVFASHRDQRLRGGIILHLTHLKTYQKENSQKFFEKLNMFSPVQDPCPGYLFGHLCSDLAPAHIMRD